jgi:tetratricopeptide (TPR) repeat protein
MEEFSMQLDELLSAGIAASRANDGERAIDYFQRAQAFNPSSGLPPFLLGSEYAALGDMAQAEAAFANAARLAPDFPLARYQLGLLQFSSGRAALGLLTWQPLLELPDTNPLPHFVNGFAALAHDQFDEALAHYEQGLQRNTENPALSGDIEKVIAGIRSLKASQRDDAPADPSADEASASHVLLANYRQSGPGH